MSVSGISSSSNPCSTQFPTVFKQRVEDFKALQSALQSGDLTGAQKAFSAFQQDVQQSSSAPKIGQTQPSMQRDQDMQALQAALQSNNLSDAQKALASLTQDAQKAHKSHHHGHHRGKNSAAASGVSAASSTKPAAAVGSLFNQQA